MLIKKKSICIIGLGYIGLPTAVIFAKYGYYVYGVDINNNLLKDIEKNNINRREPQLVELLSEVIKEGNLEVGRKPKESDIFIISVPTSLTKDKKANMKYVINATESIVKYLKKGNIVVLESTSPVGTTENLLKKILEKSNLEVGKDLYLGYCPERVAPGNIIYEIKHNDRIIGGINESSTQEISKVYETVIEGNIYKTDCRTAEMCKLMENTYRDVNIALANEFLLICNNLDINVWDAIKLSNRHPRVDILTPGPGVGGHCLAVDPWFIVQNEPNKSKVIKCCRNINDDMPYFVYKEIENLLEKSKEKKVTILGITYKANVEDIRESPIIKLIEILKNNNYKVVVFDPYIKKSNLCEENLLEACKDSDIIVLGVNHDEFKQLPWKQIKNVMKGNLVFDTRNFLNEKEISKFGLEYKVLGLI